MSAGAQRVVVAMSGGVDSSVAAAMLVEQGYQVIGVSMRLAEEGAANESSGCCSLDDFQDAARVARRLGFAHYVFDMRREFDEAVIRPFVREYLGGKTPSPCILCNRTMKFDLLRRKAAELGAAYVATGHYARRQQRGGRYRLLRGLDADKDQSYFLFEMSQQELAGVLFPVGGLRKSEVRRRAAALGLEVAEKAESQEICFVHDGRYAGFVERYDSAMVRPGKIVDREGRVLGSHGGVQRFTIGQRRGLGISAPEPLYVSAIDAERATVTVAPRGGLLAGGLEADAARWVCGAPEATGSRVQAKIRYRHRSVPATVTDAGPAGSLRLRFDEAQEAVAPGQAVVLYRGDEVLGGAWIRSAVPAAREARCA